MERPPILAWSPAFEARVIALFEGDAVVLIWSPVPGDPLRWTLSVQISRWFLDAEARYLRSLLALWCTANRCVYRRYNWHKKEWKAEILLTGLGPRCDNTPEE